MRLQTINELFESGSLGKDAKNRELIELLNDFDMNHLEKVSLMPLIHFVFFITSIITLSRASASSSINSTHAPNPTSPQSRSVRLTWVE